MRLPAKRLAIQFCLILLGLHNVLAFFGLTAREPIFSLYLRSERMRDLNFPKRTSSADVCNMLALHRKQRKICRRGRGVAETLLRATRLSALECQHQFQHERWNCTLGKYRQNILETGIKETSFLYAISSAGLVHEFARACAQGIMDRCTCDESKHIENTKTWLWGGCGDNIRFGVKFTRKFLRKARRPEKDIRARVDEQNTGAGVRAVKELVNTTCKCHGVSGSCTVKTCWLQLSPFKLVGSAIKSKYEKSERVVSIPNQVAGKLQLMKRVNHVSNHVTNSAALTMPMVINNFVPLRRSELTYIDDSPNFCRKSRYSPGTSGRSCIKDENCDSICCGRGYNIQRQRVERPCHCKVIWCCKLKCNTCVSEEEVYLCK